MEKKTKQQIIGILVIIALIIIILPLLFSKNNNETHSASLKAPPFPDQPIHNTPLAQQNEITPSPPVDQPMPTATNATTEATEALASQQTNPQISAIISAAEQPKPTNEIQTIPADTIPVHSNIMPKKAHLTQSNSVVKKQIKQGPAKIAIAHPNTPEKLKTLAWVVQLGSFKNKDNARHLTDKLRASGYKAFLHEATNPNRTNVYIGPENNKSSAKALSTQLEQQTNIHGIVIQYKLLEL